jgi:hypothetical protein
VDEETIEWEMGQIRRAGPADADREKELKPVCLEIIAPCIISLTLTSGKSHLYASTK